jgi:predicted phosphodiesterase
MRIAFISDIHGNFTALQAVLEDIRAQSIDQIVCLGDVATLGPQPVESLRALRELKCIHIMGNHDKATLDPETAEEHEIASHLISDLRWCKEKLSADDLQFISTFKPMHGIRLPYDNHILAYHGSPVSDTDIIQSTTPNEDLEVYFRGQEANIFIGGHSHLQMVRRYDNKLILNSGSVGNAFKFAYVRGKPVHLLPWAEYMIISQNGNSLGVDARRVYFDIDELLRQVRESQVPCADWWLRQYPR